MKNREQKIKRENANMRKEAFKCLLYSVPVIFVVCVALDFLKLPFWVCVMVSVVLGGFSCFLIYVLREKHKQKKEEKQKGEPKKFDPFAD